MTEILLQSSLAVRKDKQLADEVARIVQKCAVDHGEKRVIECPECFEKLLEAARSRYLNSEDQEWFSSRRAFLQELDTMFADAKEYQLDPRTIDHRIQEERSRWYAENVRGSLLRLMVEDPIGREAVFEKLEEPPAELASLARDIANILSKGLSPEADAVGLPDRLATAKDPAAQLVVLREGFFSRGGAGSGDQAVPADHQKYLDMLSHRLSMEQVVDRILEERQTAIGAREQTERLKRRLDELKRARAAHELQKTRKARNRASFAEQRVPDELYRLPPCTVCGDMPSTGDFFCCPICAILVAHEVQQKPTVYCSPECEEKGHPSHAEVHTCASGDECIQQQQEQHPEEDIDMQDDDGNSGSSSSSKLCFCTECVSSAKIPTMWCSPKCAHENFQWHREEVHIPTRQRLSLVVTDRDRLTYSEENGGGGGADMGRRYYAKDIRSHITMYDAAVRTWEEQNLVRLQR
ncbi:hypothetical protein B0T17DRAFT_522011 [Bombardia bombarda]|uniref:Uncharacterized protein n=1 Tax=Bombardia bombarda TaxID=252184 RepID=A0AA39X6H7_9PEZI|nr:hypothetical protein B0T17DRAFT_522011 [Bombardia bombarda]